MAIAYRVKDWDSLYENAQSRKVANLQWVPMPNRHDGKGFNRIAVASNAAEVFCGWCLILQVASRMPKRGTLVDGEGPLTAEDLALRTRFPVKVFESALKFLSQPKIAWIETFELGARYQNAPSTLLDHPADPALNGMEGKGTEGNGKKTASQSSGTAATASEPDESDPILFTFPTVAGKRSGVTEWHFRKSLADEMAKDFGVADITPSVRNALNWVKATPGHRKTADGMRKFITNWLIGDRNKGRLGQRSLPMNRGNSRLDYGDGGVDCDIDSPEYEKRFNAIFGEDAA